MKKSKSYNFSFHLSNEQFENNNFVGFDEKLATILVNDDDETVLNQFTKFLEELPLQVITVKSGFETLILLNKILPKLIFLDVLMPDFSGFETIFRIRNDKRFSYIPIIALTSFAMHENLNIIKKNGFTDFLLKPIKKEELIKKINQFVFDK